MTRTDKKRKAVITFIKEIVTWGNIAIVVIASLFMIVGAYGMLFKSSTLYQEEQKEQIICIELKQEINDIIEKIDSPINKEDFKIISNEDLEIYQFNLESLNKELNGRDCRLDLNNYHQLQGEQFFIDIVLLVAIIGPPIVIFVWKTEYNK